MNLSAWEIGLILLVVILLFGAKKLPDTARGLGRSLRIFKAEIKASDDDVSATTVTTTTPVPPAQPVQPAIGPSVGQAPPAYQPAPPAYQPAPPVAVDPALTQPPAGSQPLDR